MNQNQKLLEKLRKYEDDYQLVGSRIVSQSIFGTQFEDFDIESLDEENAYSVVIYLLGQLKDDTLSDIGKKAFQEIWEFLNFKNFNNIIRFFGWFPKNEIEITESQFKDFYSYNELALIKNGTHIEFYQYVKQNMPHINADEIFKDLLNDIKEHTLHEEQETYCLKFNKLFLIKTYNVNLLGKHINLLINYFSRHEKYFYYCDEQKDHMDFNYIFYGKKIDKLLINQLFDYIIKNHASIIEINDAEKSYTNFKLETGLISQSNQNKIISKV